MTAAIRAKLFLVAGLALGGLFQAVPAQAQASRDQIRVIEQEYARTHAGRPISDSQLEYYLDRMDSGWSMSRISADMSATGNGTDNWRPAQGWTAREVICSSNGGRYAECRVPFRGSAMLTRQISDSPCIEGRSWGQKPGAVWVDKGCRARFGIVRTNNNPGPMPPSERSVECRSEKGRYRECSTGFRGHVYLRHQLQNSASCVEGRSWGQRTGMVWVRNNCRATFSSVGRPGPRDDAGGWVRDPNYVVTCSSTNNNRSICTWDSRYGNPVMRRQLSSSQCVEGRDWGYDTRGGLWVNSGCRAEFGYR